ncbi:MAG TPA: hypothetical protein VGY53_07515, partial [Isosphaeraceae bacterium]|nr:hypothetical protein [Isosphaeraceae bacterium]
MPDVEQPIEPPPEGHVEEPEESRPGGVPLYVWVILAVILAIPVGLYWGEKAARLSVLSELIIRAIKAL